MGYHTKFGFETKDDNGENLAEIGRQIKGFGDDVKGLRDSMQKDLADVRKIAEEAKESSPELERKLTEMTQSVEAKHTALDELLNKSSERMDQFETALNRSPAGGSDEGEADATKAALAFFETKAAAKGSLNWNERPNAETADIEGYKAWEDVFEGYMRVGDQALIDPEEQKALSVGRNPNGGYLVPTARSSRIIEKIYETSPMRSLATVETIGTEALEIPLDRDEADAGWVGEEETRSETGTPDVGLQRIPVHEMYAKPKVTQTFLEDAAINVEAWLDRKVAEKMARKEATAFIIGNGVKKPRGILSYDTGATADRGRVLAINSGAATAVTADGVVSMPYQLKAQYMARGSFMMRRSSVLAVMLLKDNDGQYMWRPGLTEGARSTLVGYGLNMADDMPDIAANALSLAFGDWMSSYTVVDRLGITTLRDPYSEKPFVQFYTRKRVGGDVVDFDGYCLMRIAA